MGIDEEPDGVGDGTERWEDGGTTCDPGDCSLTCTLAGHPGGSCTAAGCECARGADADGDVDSGADLDVDTGADADANADADRGEDGDVDADRDADTDVDADADGDVAGDDGPGGAGTCGSPLSMPGPGLYAGDTTGLPALHDPTCSGWEQPSTEQIWILTVTSPVTTRFQLHPTAHWDPSIYVHHDCAVVGGTTLDFCADEVMWGEDEDLSATLGPGDWYVFVDGYISSGPYELTVTFL
ncbi:MAG: hypothetical protein QME96_08590 [Myxococcota bacterium]|nr:hypothetical protein [Myxococcota bacterium]